MKFRFALLLILIILIKSVISLAIYDHVDIEANFTSSGTQTISLSIPFSLISNIEFMVNGSLYNSNYPSNVTIDIAQNSFIDWSYNPYHSNISESTSNVIDAFTTNNTYQNIHIVSGMNEFTTLVDSFGYLHYDDFTSYGLILNGTLGIYSTNELYNQIITITTNETTLHAFLPNISTPVPMAGFYIAKGGSSYYCNSNHQFVLTLSCNLTISQAMTPSHLARKANKTSFDYAEPVRNQRVINVINQELSGCSLPCTINISVTSDTAGKISLTNIEITKANNPSNISIVETGSTYDVSISSSGNLSSVYYYYGYMPNVYIVPVVAADDNLSINANQQIRFDKIKNDIAIAWDNLTNKSHPLNITVFQTPIIIDNYNMSQNNFSDFWTKATTKAHNQNALDEYKIFVMLDIHDYFPTQTVYNQRNIGGKIISDIYFNGFSNNNPKTNIFKYDEQGIINILLHELSHTFIYYPTNQGRLFYSDHPSSFTNINIPSYSTAQSPTSNEGYYEIYSILNQLRPFIASQDIGNTQPALSPIDKMLLGILTPAKQHNYTFYEATVTNNSNRFNASSINSSNVKDANSLYFLSSDKNAWDVRDYSNTTFMFKNTSFSIDKTVQNNRALWVFANDYTNPEHYKVFNNNAHTSIFLTYPFYTPSLTSPMNYFVSHNKNITFVCDAPNVVDNISLYTNQSGILIPLFSNNSGSYINTTLTDVSYGGYVWDCLSCYNGVCSFSDNPRFFRIKDVFPRYLNFNGMTTKFRDFDSASLISMNNVVLEILRYGKIEFLQAANFSELDLDTYVHIIHHEIGINTNILSRLNISAKISFYNVTLQYPIILKDDVYCTDCILFSKNATNVTFLVTHFSNYSIGINSKLLIWDDGPKDEQVIVNFYANYTNITNLEFIANATCNLNIDSTNYLMNQDSLIYSYFKSFSTANTYNYYISCNKTGFENLTVFDSVLINSVIEIPPPSSGGSGTSGGGSIFDITGDTIINEEIIDFNKTNNNYTINENSAKSISNVSIGPNQTSKQRDVNIVKQDKDYFPIAFAMVLVFSTLAIFIIYIKELPIKKIKNKVSKQSRNKLKHYIKNARKNGFSDMQIIQKVKIVGWDKDIINELMKKK